MGQLHANPAYGGLMGNRGILHDDAQQICRTHAHQAWVTCQLDFKGRKRQIMAPGRYTELFFLDEATALAAGHRPCGECRRDAYRSFAELWKQAHGMPAQGRSLPQTMDRVLHRARIARGGTKVTYLADACDLPDGAIIALDRRLFLIWGDKALAWGFGGYTQVSARPKGTCTVVTPEPTVALMTAGYRPGIHSSAQGLL